MFAGASLGLPGRLNLLAGVLGEHFIKYVPSVEKKDAALYPLSCNRYRVLVIDNMFFLGRIGIS